MFYWNLFFCVCVCVCVCVIKRKDGCLQRRCSNCVNPAISICCWLRCRGFLFHISLCCLWSPSNWSATQWHFRKTYCSVKFVCDGWTLHICWYILWLTATGDCCSFVLLLQVFGNLYQSLSCVWFLFCFLFCLIEPIICCLLTQQYWAFVKKKRSCRIMKISVCFNQHEIKCQQSFIWVNVAARVFESVKDLKVKYVSKTWTNAMIAVG